MKSGTLSKLSNTAECSSLCGKGGKYVRSFKKKKSIWNLQRVYHKLVAVITLRVKPGDLSLGKRNRFILTLYFCRFFCFFFFVFYTKGMY